MSQASAASGKQWFGHPQGLSTLFFTEMWERFSYYGMRGILVLYMTNAVSGMAMDRGTATAIYGLYTAGVYLLALPGGWVADRLVGQKQAVFIGGSIIALGHFSMAVPNDMMFFLGLILIVIGTGLLKPNVSAIVGDLYPEGGVRRDAGFSIFYMGINLGAFLGPLVCGYLGENVNWHYGFGAAGVGMVLGLIQYKLGSERLEGAGEITTPAGEKRPWNQLFIGLAVLGAIAVALFGLQNAGTIAITLQGFAGATGVIIVLLAFLYFGYQLLFGGLDTTEKKRMVVIFLLFVGAALFWSGFEQAGSSLNIFAEDKTNRTIFGWLMPASWLQSVNALFIIIFAPVFAGIWVALGKRDRSPSIPAKFGIGLVLLGGGFLVMRLAAQAYDASGGAVGPMWLVVTYFLHTAGELCLSPVGLSSVTKLSPRRLVGQMMGIWFMGSALGNLIAGLAAGESNDVKLFTDVAITSVAAGLVFLLFAKLIQKLIGNLK